MLERIQHPFGIRGHFQGVHAALPGSLNPEYRIRRQRFGLPGKEQRRVILIGGQGYNLTKLLNGPRILPLQNALSQRTGGPQLHLLLQKSALDSHKFFRFERQKAAILIPKFLLGILAKFFLKPHGLPSSSADLRLVRHAARMLVPVGIKNGTVFW